MIAFATTGKEPSPSIGESMTSLGGTAGEIAAEADAILKTVATNRPLLVVGAALAAGVILGWLIKRR